MQLKSSSQPVAVRDGKFTAKHGHGKFVQRKPSHF
jgi:hypothetical protein